MAPSTSVVMNGNTTTNGILDQAASGANGNRELITDEYTEALALIEAALPKMSTLNALLELDISEGEGKERPYIYISTPGPTTKPPTSFNHAQTSPAALSK
jgi:hypothetical protein